MPRPLNIFKKTTNRFLDLLAEDAGRDNLPSELELAKTLDASRTTIRKVLDRAEEIGLITNAEQGRRRLRPPMEDDYFDEDQTATRPEHIERTFLQAVVDGRLKPGQRFSETDLARLCGASTASVREFLIDFSRFGLIKKRPRGGWTLHGFDKAFAEELADMRALVELAAFDRMAASDLDAANLHAIDDLIARHERLEEPAADFTDFPTLDQEFHSWLLSHLSNRFARNLLSAIAMIFFYQYQWPTTRRRQRAIIAVGEHLDILRPLRQGDVVGARKALNRHLETSHNSMLAALETSIPDPPPN